MFPDEPFRHGVVRSGRRAGFRMSVTALPMLLVCYGSMAAQSEAGWTYRHDTVSRPPARPKPPSYQRDGPLRRGEGPPWSIHIARIERSRPDLVLRSTLARETVDGLSTLAQQVQALPPMAGRPLVALNGDFYVTDERNPYLGDPRGLQILEGELVSAATDQASFWIDSNGQPQATNVISKLAVTWPDGSVMALGLNEDRHNGSAVLYTPRMASSTRTRGGREFVLERAGSGSWLPLRAGHEYTARVRELRDVGNSPLSNDLMVLSVSPALLANKAVAKAATGTDLKISTATIPNLSGVSMAISGGFVLVRNGKTEKLNVPHTSAYKYRTVGERHPRSALGFSRDFIYLLEVDGRQPGLSVGMTLAELAEYMQKLGCELAMNLDGGASATFWMEGRVRNSPCSKFERPIANGIVVLQKNPSAPKAADAR